MDAAITIAPVVEAAAGMATAGKACMPNTPVSRNNTNTARAVVRGRAACMARRYTESRPEQAGRVTR